MGTSKDANDSWFEGILSISHGVIVTDPTFTILKWNKGAERIYGWTEKEVVGKEITNVTKLEFPLHNQEEVIQSFFQVGSWEGEVIQQRKDGKRVNIYSQVSLIRDQFGNPLNVIGVNVDITHQKDLANQLQLMDKAVNASIDAIFILDCTGIIRYVNKTVMEAYGLTRKEEIIGKNGLDRIIPEDRETVSTAIQELYTQGSLQGVEYRVNTIDGVLSVEANGVVICNEYEEQLGAAIIVRNITERKNIEKKLRNSEEQFRSLAEESPNMIFINRKGKVVYANKKSEDIMKYSREEMCASDFDFFKLIAPESRSVVQSAFVRHLKGKEVSPYEYTLLTKDRVKMHAIITTKLINYEGDEAILGIVTDITERKRVEVALQRSEERLRNIFSVSHDPIIVFDNHGKIVECNQATSQLFQQSQEECIGADMFEMVSEVDHGRLRQNLQVSSEGISNPVNLSLKKKSGVTFPAEVSLGVIKNDQLDTHEHVAVIKDITLEKIREEELKKKLMKFNLDLGSVYLIKESTPQLAIEAFEDFLRLGYHGCVISRIPELEFIKFMKEHSEFKWLAESGQALFPDLANIETIIRTTSKKTVILFDGLNYVITKNGFPKTYSLIQRIRDFAYTSDFSVIFRADPTLLTTLQLRLLETEMKPITLRGMVQLPDTLNTILQFIFKQNMIGVKPNYTSVKKEMKISKPTTSKRIQQLKNLNYLNEFQNGKNKTLELTPTGRTLFL
jgi:PAS domain S-box-containing protein